MEVHLQPWALQAQWIHPDLHDALKITQLHVTLSYHRDIKCCNPNKKAVSNSFALCDIHISRNLFDNIQTIKGKHWRETFVSEISSLKHSGPLHSLLLQFSSLFNSTFNPRVCDFHYYGSFFLRMCDLILMQESKSKSFAT